MSTRFSDVYEKGELIERGGFGDVYKCISKATRQEYAVKIIKADGLGSSFSDIDREIFLCRSFDHENVLKLIEAIVNIDVYYIVLELMRGGDLYDDLEKRKNYTESNACRCIKQVLNGVAYLHGKKIIHRDLKPANLLLSGEDEESNVKIADFGSAIAAGTDIRRYTFFNVNQGTKGYCAPELFKKEPYCMSIDTWSCGVILYNTLFGIAPFPLTGEKEMKNKIVAAEYRFPDEGECEPVCDAAKDLIGKLLNVDRHTRYTAEEALAHPFVRDGERIASRSNRTKTLKNMKLLNGVRRKWKQMKVAASRALKSPSPRRCQIDDSLVTPLLKGEEGPTTSSQLYFEDAMLSSEPKKPAENVSGNKLLEGAACCDYSNTGGARADASSETKEK